MNITEDTPIACLTVGQFINMLKDYMNSPTPETGQNEINERLGVKELMTLTGYSRDSIYKLVRQRKLPFYRFAETGRLWFKRIEISEWIENQKRKTFDELIQEKKIRF